MFAGRRFPPEGRGAARGRVAGAPASAWGAARPLPAAARRPRAAGTAPLFPCSPVLLPALSPLPPSGLLQRCCGGSAAQPKPTSTHLASCCEWLRVGWRAPSSCLRRCRRRGRVPQACLAPCALQPQGAPAQPSLITVAPLFPPPPSTPPLMQVGDLHRGAARARPAARPNVSVHKQRTECAVQQQQHQHQHQQPHTRRPASRVWPALLRRPLCRHAAHSSPFPVKLGIRPGATERLGPPTPPPPHPHPPPTPPPHTHHPPTHPTHPPTPPTPSQRP